MTIEMTLQELDFPTPDVTEAWEPTAAEVTSFTDWMYAETVYNTAVKDWIDAENRYESERYHQLMKQYRVLSMSDPSRCYCSPSRGMMLDPWYFDTYGPAGYANANAQLEAQIAYLRERIQAQQTKLTQQMQQLVASVSTAPVEPTRRRWYSIFG